jgi:hypothetical protein
MAVPHSLLLTVRVYVAPGHSWVTRLPWGSVTANVVPLQVPGAVRGKQ